MEHDRDVSTHFLFTTQAYRYKMAAHHNDHSGGGDHASHSHDRSQVSNKRLGLAAAVNISFAVVQVIVGLALGSVVVLADALHQVVDAVGLLTALVALVLVRRPATTSMSYGWGKIDALGGYTSGLLLLGSIVWIMFESIGRLSNPVEVDGGGVILIGVAGVAVNGASVLILGEGEHLSLKAARLHLIVDLAGSVVVVMAGLLLQGTSYSWIDPAASLLINALVLHGTYTVLRAAGGELLDRSPTNASVDQIDELLRSVEGFNEVHHIHTRSLGPGLASMTAHVVIGESLGLHNAQETMHAIQDDLAERFGIAHSTIQLECHTCEDIAH
jgi:cobalt-zinc-cadmium efflux system protein